MGLDMIEPAKWIGPLSVSEAVDRVKIGYGDKDWPIGFIAADPSYKAENGHPAVHHRRDEIAYLK